MTKVRLIPSLGVFDEWGSNRFSDYRTVEGDTGTIRTDIDLGPTFTDWVAVELDNGKGIVPCGPGHYEVIDS